MECSGSRPMQAHLVTPEEPRTDDIGINNINEDSESPHNNVRQNVLRGLHNDRLNDYKQNDTEDSFDSFIPSAKNTRKLEIEILIAIQYLKDHDDDSDHDHLHLVDILNRSLTAISHWSLQAQLAQLRRTDDDRHVVEKHLLKREMEALLNQRSSRKPYASSRQKRIKSSAPSLSVATTTAHPYSSSRNAAGTVSPATPQKKIVSSLSKKHSMISMTPSGNEVDPASLKLVESKKPHPRMRRTSDNPMTNEYVRVFHLERK